MHQQCKPSESIGIRAAARLVNVHENTIRGWIKSGLITPVWILPSGFRRVDPAEVIALAGKAALNATGK